MSLLADAAQPLLPQGLLSVRGRLDEQSLPDILIEPRVGYALTFDINDQSMLIDFGGGELLAEAMAFDVSRLAAASFQTLCAIEDDPLSRNNLAWGLVKLYYAAFYSGHVLLRLLGESCSFFDRPQITRIAALAHAAGTPPPFSVDRGFYKCVLTQGASALKCTRAGGGVKGSHEAFWGVFGDRIGLLMTQVLQGPLVRSDAQAVYTRLQELKTILGIRAGSSWLSAIRNDVQYRQRYGVWYPAGLSKPEQKKLGRLVALWKSDPMGISLDPARDAPLGPFASAAIFIVAFCHALLTRLAERSSVGARSFVQLGPMAYLKMRAA